MNPPQVYTCSQSRTPLPPPPLHHPSGSSQCTSSKHPAPGFEPRQAICFLYDIHVSMPFSQIIPPAPSPTESKRLFYTSVSLLLSRIQGYYYHLSKFHIHALVYCIYTVLKENKIHSTNECSTQSQIRYVKKWENETHDRRKIDPEMTEIMELIVMCS